MSRQQRFNGPIPRRVEYAEAAAETLEVLPSVLKELPTVNAYKSDCLHLDYLAPLDPSRCPRFSGSRTTAIRVLNADTINAAIELMDTRQPRTRVAVLNMASHKKPGGGWLNGAIAQEEALCYRSSLALSLHKRYYPFRQLTGVYTPQCVVIRTDMATGHTLLVPAVNPEFLPIISVLSVAALLKPELKKITVDTAAGKVQRTEFARAVDRNLTKMKMRLCLRMAGRKGNSSLVLGALGCGVFGNPKYGVACCWLEVLREPEFSGGWWENVWFAVFDSKNDGNFEIFKEVLEGQEV